MLISRKKYEEAIKAARQEAVQTYMDTVANGIKEEFAECIDQIRRCEERITKKIDGKELTTKQTYCGKRFLIL